MCYSIFFRLQSLLDIQKSLYGWSFWLNSSVNIFDYVGGILSYLIIAIPIFGGQYDDLAAEELSAVISRVCLTKYNFDLRSYG